MERREGIFASWEAVSVDTSDGFSVRYAEVLNSASEAVSVCMICFVVFSNLVFNSVVVIVEFTVTFVFELLSIWVVFL